MEVAYQAVAAVIKNSENPFCILSGQFFFTAAILTVFGSPVLPAAAPASSLP